MSAQPVETPPMYAPETVTRAIPHAAKHLAPHLAVGGKGTVKSAMAAPHASGLAASPSWGLRERSACTQAAGIRCSPER